ncbi:MAG: hypothetical protein JSS09_08645, partial [Verrucomicrobia bacterium]|nr:hypothetical protein [Verrucomicrobiota bacterium]
MDQEWFMTKKDIKRIFFRHKKKYIRIFMWVSCLILFFRLIDPPCYTTNATFRFAVQGQEQSDLLRSFIQNSKMASGKEGGAQAVLESRTLLRQVVEHLGLALEEPKPFIFVRWLQAAKDRIFAELGMKTPDRRMFIFSDVHLVEENPSDFFIRFLDEKKFEVIDLTKKKIAEGMINSSTTFQGNEFTLKLEKTPQNGKLYKIKTNSWFNAVKNHRSQLKVKPNKMDKSIFSLVFSHSNPKVAADFINSLMASYREYLKKENEEMAATQMQYLEKRQ